MLAAMLFRKSRQKICPTGKWPRSEFDRVDDRSAAINPPQLGQF
jgi:hypothetical protein